jgi:hypothetical protein
MVIPYRERGKVIPNEAGMAALKQWVESAPDIGQKGARALHIKSLHTPRGMAAKTLGFFWLDVPFRAAGAAVRAGFQPNHTCPLCVALAEDGLTPRGSVRRAPVSSPARSAIVPPVGSSEIVWVEHRRRYQLGYTLASPYYGIWDRANPGPAVCKYPYSEYGKSEADKRFDELEAEAASGPAIPSHTAPPQTSNTYGF